MLAALMYTLLCKLLCLQGVCSESASFDLPAAVLAACVQEIQSALEVALVRREDGSAQRGGEIFVAAPVTAAGLKLPDCNLPADLSDLKWHQALTVYLCVSAHGLIRQSISAAGSEGKVDYFEMANNMRILKVSPS